VVFQGSGYRCSRISTHAIEYAIQQMGRKGTISDAIGYTYQQDGHVFYVLSFPTGGQTWVYDSSCEMWHQRAWTDANGELARDRTNCGAFINGLNVAGDWENGTIYALDTDVWQDTVGGVAGPISFIRTFPHIQGLPGLNGQLMPLDGKRVRFLQFVADIESGHGPADGSIPSLSLRWSDDRGQTFGNAVLQTNGTPGQYSTQPSWRGLGEARDRIFELSYSFNGKAALNGAWVEGTVLNT
jgi:hypothetical protein